MAKHARLDPRLAQAMAEVNKEHPGSVVLGRELKSRVIPRIPSGSIALDAVLGGGWPANQVHEIIGDESHGKTAVALKTIAKNQEQDPNWTALWIAAEPFVEEYAEKLGVDLDRVVLVETNIMEEAYEAILKFSRLRAVDAVVLDSLPALTPSPEAMEAFTDWQVGLGARLTGKFLRVRGEAGRRSLVEDDRLLTMFVINQWREKVGVMYGDPRTTPGGRGKNYFYFTRVVVKRDEYLTEKHEGVKEPVRVGQVIKALTLKNKAFPPQKVADIHFYFADAENGMQAGEYDLGVEIASLGVVHGVLRKAGSWLSYGDQQWQGARALAQAMREDSTLAEQLSAEILAAVESKVKRIGVVPEPEEEPSPRRRRRTTGSK